MGRRPVRRSQVIFVRATEHKIEGERSMGESRQHPKGEPPEQHANPAKYATAKRIFAFFNTRAGGLVLTFLLTTLFGAALTGLIKLYQSDRDRDATIAEIDRQDGLRNMQAHIQQ